MDESLEAQAGALAIRDLQLLEQTNFPLTLTAAVAPRIPLKITYDSTRFDEATIARMFDHLHNLSSA
jgi:hypothetical protein